MGEESGYYLVSASPGRIPGPSLTTLSLPGMRSSRPVRLLALDIITTAIDEQLKHTSSISTESA